MLKGIVGGLAGWRGYALAFVLGALLAGAGAWKWQANAYGRQLSERGRELAELRTGQANQVAAAVDAARREYQGKVERQTEIANDATKVAESARNDARAADAVARELRARATTLANAGRTVGGPAAIGGGAPADGAAVVLADLFGRADARAGELAAALDASRGAGLACERSYDALTPSLPAGQ